MSGHIFPSSDGKIIAFQPENSYRQAEEGQQARSSGKIEEEKFIMLKKVFTMIGTSVLAAALLVGGVACGGGGDDGKTGPINIFTTASGLSDDALNADPVAEYIRETTGEDIHWINQPTSADDSTTILQNVLVNRLTGYDLLYISKDAYLTYLVQGAFYDISSYFDTMENDPRELISDLGWDMVTVDGGIYGIPVKSARQVSNNAIAYRVDYFEAYNAAHSSDPIPVPDEDNGYSMTVSDFTDLVIWISENLTIDSCTVEDSGYDSHSVDHAFMIAANTNVVENIATAFGVYQNWADSDNDGDVEYLTEQTGFADYMKYMNYMTNKGYFYYDVDTANTVANALVITENASDATQGDAGTAMGVVAHWSTTPYEGTSTTEANDEYAYITALIPDNYASDEDVAGMTDDEMRANAVRVFSSESYGGVWAIPAFIPEGKVDRIMNLIDELLDPDVFRTTYIGEKDVNYTVDEDGEYWPTDQFNAWATNADKLVIALREEDVADYWMCRVRKTAGQWKQFSVAAYNVDEITGMKDPTTFRGQSEVYDANQTLIVAEVQLDMIALMYPLTPTGLITDAQIESVKAQYMTERVAGTDATGAEIIADVNSWYTTWIESNADFTHSARNVNQKFADLGLN